MKKAIQISCRLGKPHNLFLMAGPFRGGGGAEGSAIKKKTGFKKLYILPKITYCFNWLKNTV